MAKHPNIKIELVGQDGNAFSILARCQDALKRNGLHEEVSAFHAEATADDYGHLLRTVMEWFSIGSQNDEYEDEEAFYAEHPNGCYECGEKYAVGGCPSCGW